MNAHSGQEIGPPHTQGEHQPYWAARAKSLDTEMLLLQEIREEHPEAAQHMIKAVSRWRINSIRVRELAARWLDMVYVVSRGPCGVRLAVC